MQRTNVTIGDQRFPVSEVKMPHPSITDEAGNKITTLDGYWKVGTYPIDSKNPGNAYLAKRTPELDRALLGNGYTVGKRLADKTTILRRLGGF